MRFQLLELHAELLQKFDHALHVADVWDVVEDHRFARQQAPRQHRERGILVARGGHFSAKGCLSVNDQLFHGYLMQDFSI